MDRNVSGKLKINPLEIENIFFHDNFAGSDVAENGAKIFMSLNLIEQITLTQDLEEFLFKMLA